MPAAMMSLIVSVASSTESKMPRSVRTPCGSRVSRVQILVTTASVPSLPTSVPTRSQPDVVFAGPAELNDRAVGHHRLDPQRVIDRHAIFQGVWTAGIGGHVAADGAGPLARRIGSVVIAGPLEGIGEPEIDHARLNDGVAIAEVDFQDLPHPRQRDHHSAADRQTAAGQAGAGATGQIGQAVAVADLHDCRHLLGRFGKDDRVGAVLLDHEAVALENDQLAVGRQDLGPADHFG